MTPRRLVILGDSLAFTDHEGPKLPDDPRLYPNILAGILSNATSEPWQPIVIARPGADARETWRTVSKDRHVQFDVLRGADAVVVAIGSFDHAPAAIPPMIDAMIPYLRPTWLRRWARSTTKKLHPKLARHARKRARTPMSEFSRVYDLTLRMVRGLAKDAAGVVLGPTSHRSIFYGGLDGRHPMRGDRERAQFEIAARHGFPQVACWPLVERFADQLNRDGIHWPPQAHAAVAGALAGPILDQLNGSLPRPPWFDEEPLA